MQARIPALSPNEWKNGLMIRYRSSARKPTTPLHSQKARMEAAWPIIAPFGAPVVPEVKRMSHMSSPATAAARDAVSAAVAPSARSRNASHDTVPSGAGPRNTTISSTQSGTPPSAARRSDT